MAASDWGKQFIEEAERRGDAGFGIAIGLNFVICSGLDRYEWHGACAENGL